MEKIRLTPPLSEDEVRKLRVGDQVLISGTIYSARDAAHARLVRLLEEGKELPIPIEGQVIYYAGPTPAKPGRVIGSAGPTTSYRMDPYAPKLIAKGLRGMIGKGARSEPVVEAMKKHGAVYLAAVGGAGALISKRIKSARVVAYEDLGAEAIRMLEVEDFPATVAQDSVGGDLYEIGRKTYAITEK